MNIFDNRDLYTDTYYDGAGRLFYNTTTLRDYGTVSTFFRGTLVLLLRAGFIFVQLSSIPTSNLYVLLLHNLLDVALTTISFVFLGHMFAFGDKDARFISIRYFVLSVDDDMDEIILGWCAVIAASSIMITMLSGRMHSLGLFLVVFVFAGVVQPIFIHWIWTKNGWMQKWKLFDERVALKDYSGALLIHVCGAVCGFIGVLFLGRRILRLRDIQENSIGTDAPGLCVVGYFFIILGLLGLSLPSKAFELSHVPGNYMGLVLLNNIVAASGGIITVIMFHLIVDRERFNYWVVLRCIQGALAGIITVSAGTDVYSPICALIISIIGGISFYFAAKFMFYSPFEDYCNVVALHLVCGFIGILLPPLFGQSENLGFMVSRKITLVHLSWQFICCSGIVCIICVIYSLIFLSLNGCGFLRSSIDEHEHRRARTIVDRGARRCSSERLFLIKQNSVILEPSHRLKRLFRKPARQSGKVKISDKIPNNEIHKGKDKPPKSKEEKSAAYVVQSQTQPTTEIVKSSEKRRPSLEERNADKVTKSLPRSYSIKSPFDGGPKRQRHVFTVHTEFNNSTELPMFEGQAQESIILKKNWKKTRRVISESALFPLESQFARNGYLNVKRSRSKSVHDPFFATTIFNISPTSRFLETGSVNSQETKVAINNYLRPTPIRTTDEDTYIIKNIPWHRNRKRNLIPLRRITGDTDISKTMGSFDGLQDYRRMLRSVDVPLGGEVSPRLNSNSLWRLESVQLPYSDVRNKDLILNVPDNHQENSDFSDNEIIC